MGQKKQTLTFLNYLTTFTHLLSVQYLQRLLISAEINQSLQSSKSM